MVVPRPAQVLQDCGRRCRRLRPLCCQTSPHGHGQPGPRDARSGGDAFLPGPRSLLHACSCSRGSSSRAIVRPAPLLTPSPRVSGSGTRSLSSLGYMRGAMRHALVWCYGNNAAADVAGAAGAPGDRPEPHSRARGAHSQHWRMRHVARSPVITRFPYAPGTAVFPLPWRLRTIPAVRCH
jgi:hypothetical protein